MAGEFLSVGGRVDDVGDFLIRDGLGGAVGGRDYDIPAGSLDGAGLDWSLGDGSVFAKDGKVGGRAQLLHFGHGNGNFTGHIAIEDDGITDAADELSGQLIPVGEDEDVRCWFVGVRSLGLGEVMKRRNNERQA